MKKIILGLMMLLCFGAWGTPPARGALTIALHSRCRIDFSGADNIEFSRRTVYTNRGERQELLLTFATISANWQQLNFTITPSSTGMVDFHMGAARGSRGADPWIQIDQIRAQGTEVLNGGFTQLNENGHLADWQSTSENLLAITENFRTKHLLRLNYSYPVQQRLLLTGRQPVKFAVTLRAEGADSGERLQLVPAFENCSVYLKYPNSSTASNLKPQLFFREIGKINWQQALPLVANSALKTWSGSIFRLKPGTLYEMELELPGNNPVKFRKIFRTLKPEFKIRRNLTVNPNPRGETILLARSGSPQNFVRYLPATPSVLRSKNSRATVLARDLRYVILDGLKIDARGGAVALKLLNCARVIIRNCEFFNFSRAGVELSYSGEILIERCVFHHPQQAKAGILVHRVPGKLIIRHNDFLADSQNFFDQAIGATDTTSRSGGLVRDCDIYGNMCAFARQEALSLGGRGSNLRIYLNRFEGGQHGTNTGSCQQGPIYLIRNLYRNQTSLPWKNYSTVRGNGTLFYLNNTVEPSALNSDLIVDAFFPTTGKIANSPVKFFARNNLIRGGAGRVFAQNFTHFNCDIDNEMFYFATSKATDLNRSLFDRFNCGANNIYATPHYAGAAWGDFNLAPGSPGLNRAARLPNLGYLHMGAFQGDWVRSLPGRPLPWGINRPELHFLPGPTGTMQLELNPHRLTVARRFEVFAMGGFFKVYPNSGVLKSHQKREITVTLLPGKMKTPGQYRGCVLVRFADGISCPVTVYAEIPAPQR